MFLVVFWKIDDFIKYILTSSYLYYETWGDLFLFVFWKKLKTQKGILKLTDLYKIQPWAFAKHSLEKYFAAKMPRSNWKGILVVHCIQAEKKLSMYLNEKLLSIYNRESLIPYLLISGPLSNNTRISNNACTWHTFM